MIFSWTRRISDTALIDGGVRGFGDLGDGYLTEEILKVGDVSVGSALDGDYCRGVIVMGM